VDAAAPGLEATRLEEAPLAAISDELWLSTAGGNIVVVRRNLIRPQPAMER
jgi:hypothetical protein